MWNWGVSLYQRMWTSEAASRTEPPSFKVLVVGNPVGKSSQVHRMVSGLFSDNYVPTIGVEVVLVQVETSCGPVRLQIWDTAVLPRFDVCLPPGVAT